MKRRLAAGRLATDTLVDTVSHVECVHRAIATRAFTFTDPVSLPVRFVHDGITTGVYALIRRTALTGGLVATELFGANRQVGPTGRIHPSKQSGPCGPERHAGGRTR